MTWLRFLIAMSLGINLLLMFVFALSNTPPTPGVAIWLGIVTIIIYYPIMYTCEHIGKEHPLDRWTFKE